MSKGLVLIDQYTKNKLTVTIRYIRFILPPFDLKVLSSHSIQQFQNTPIITYKKQPHKGETIIQKKKKGGGAGRGWAGERGGGVEGVKVTKNYNHRRLTSIYLLFYSILFFKLDPLSYH